MVGPVQTSKHGSGLVYFKLESASCLAAHILLFVNKSRAYASRPLPATGSAGSDKARVVGAAAATATITTAKNLKYGTLTHQEYTTVVGLLGVDADDEDFCPTCLEAYTDGEQCSGGLNS